VFLIIDSLLVSKTVEQRDVFEEITECPFAANMRTSTSLGHESHLCTKVSPVTPYVTVREARESSALKGTDAYDVVSQACTRLPVTMRGINQGSPLQFVC
jgi:hypothetical protein